MTFLFSSPLLSFSFFSFLSLPALFEPKDPMSSPPRRKLSSASRGYDFLFESEAEKPLFPDDEGISGSSPSPQDQGPTSGPTTTTTPSSSSSTTVSPRAVLPSTSPQAQDLLRGLDGTPLNLSQTDLASASSTQANPALKSFLEKLKDPASAPLVKSIKR